jgi:ABC-type uncharacterized transport system permease subunit
MAVLNFLLALIGRDVALDASSVLLRLFSFLADFSGMFTPLAVLADMIALAIAKQQMAVSLSARTQSFL